MHIWLLMSNLTLMVFRVLHFVGQYLSGESVANDPDSSSNNALHVNQGNTRQFNWDKMASLKKLSFTLLLLVYPYFTAWTVLGTIWFVQSNYETPDCVSNACNVTS